MTNNEPDYTNPNVAIAALGRIAAQSASDILSDAMNDPDFAASDACDELNLNLEFALLCADALTTDDCEELAARIICDEVVFDAFEGWGCIHILFSTDDAPDFPLIPAHCLHD